MAEVAAMDWELVVDALSKRFPARGREVAALEDVSLSVATGEFITILGPSGCGKSTLLRCVAGFERPTRGSVFVGGRRVNGPGSDRVMVFQSFDQLFPWLTAIDNVAFALRATHTARGASASRRAASSYLGLVGLKDCGDLYPHQLSGGMKQRVAIARALSVGPRILLMDEPFGSLDALTRGALEDELERIWRETGVTVLFVTHNIEEAIIQSDRIVVLSGRPGRVAAIVPNLLPRPRSPDLPGFGEVWDVLRGLLGLRREGGSVGRARRRTVFEEVSAAELALR